MYGSASGFRGYRHYDNDANETEERESWESESDLERRPRFSPIMNPHIVPPSQHTLFMRGFNPNTEMNKIRDFFTKEGGKCSFDFFKVSQDGSRLFVALRFESKDVARDILNKYDNTSVLGSKITITWFKDLRRARLKAMQHGQRWTNYYGNMKNGYNRGYGHKFGSGGKLKSTIWRQQNKGGDHSYQYMQDRRRKDRKHDDRRRSSSSSRSHSYSRSRSRSHSRTKSRSHSRSRSRTRSRSWSHSRSRERSTSPSGRRYRTPSSSSSRGSSRWVNERSKRRSWKGDPAFSAPEAMINQPAEPGPTAESLKQDAAQEDGDITQKEEEINWENVPQLEGDDSITKNADAELMEIAQMQCVTSPVEKVANDSESRSRSSSATDRSHSKDRKKKKKKHHRSKHRRHRHHRRHHHHPSSDEEGQVSEFEEGERSPTPDTHRRYRKRDRRSSSSSPESPTRPDKRRAKAPQNSNLSLSHLTDGINQHEELSLPPETPLESDGHSVKSLRSIDAPSQISDGMSPLHVSEGDDEVIAAQDKRDESSALENRTVANEVDSLLFLSSHLLNEENKEDNIGTAFGYSSVHSAGQNEIEQMESVVASSVEQSSGGGNQGQTASNEQAKLALRTKVGVATKSLLEKYKFSMKSSLSSSKEAASSAKHVSPRQAGIAEEMFSTDTSPHNLEPPPPIARCFSPEIDMIGKEMPVKSSPIVVVAPPAIGANVEVRNSSPLVTAEDTAPSISTPTSLPGKFHIELSSLSCENIGDLGSAESSVTSKKDAQATKENLSKDKIQLIRRKRAEIETAYRRDCQTFATVVKMLIRKDQTLDEKIQDSFRENLFDIGQQCIRDLQEFVEAILTSDD